MITFELVITAAIVILAVLYVTILLKLKPSTENKDQHKKDLVTEKRKPRQNGPIFVNSLKTKEKATLPQRTQTQINPQKIQHPTTKTVNPAAPFENTPEAPKHVVKPENRSPNTHCIHHFSYLRKLPKNTPIPTECLGCPRIVECMTTLNIEKKPVKSHVTHS